MNTTIDTILSAATALASTVERASASCGYEEKGILNSEILFMAACLHPDAPQRIIESGRAKGQSTALLATLFPDTEIVSVELDRGTPDDQVAVTRLSPFPNVRLLYGDSLKVLSPLVRDGDVVLVDGPKGSLGIELCLKLNRASQLRATFLHDSHHTQLERIFTEAFWGGATYSDHPEYIERFRRLDDPCWSVSDAGGRDWHAPFTRKGMMQQSYGPTLAFLPALKKRDARWQLRELNRLRGRFPRWRR